MGYEIQFNSTNQSVGFISWQRNDLFVKYMVPRSTSYRELEVTGNLLTNDLFEATPDQQERQECVTVELGPV